MRPSQAMEGTSCVARRQLAEEFVVAARLYYEAVVQLSAYSTNATSKGDSDRLRHNARQAHERMEDLRVAFETHVESHQCLE
jgi:hypothetical protein